ncbi:hypothetical protein C4K17_1098 [Pseudomonas chlororaphis subsp. aurantiaca]|nr:hypothetical protein C4K17_1098 [Pseudomonas chlororaphis subsp. aurantiaca]
MLHRSELLWSNTQGCGFGAGVARGGSEACQKRAEQGRSRWVLRGLGKRIDYRKAPNDSTSRTCPCSRCRACEAAVGGTAVVNQAARYFRRIVVSRLAPASSECRPDRSQPRRLGSGYRATITAWEW